MISLWPWSAISEARREAEKWRGRARAHEAANVGLDRTVTRLRADIAEVHRANDFLRTERDDARRRLARPGVAIRNRLAGQKLRSASAPPLITTAHPGDPRTEQTG